MHTAKRMQPRAAAPPRRTCASSGLRSERRKWSSGRCSRQAGSMPSRRHASTERGLVGMQAAAVHPGSTERSATSRTVNLALWQAGRGAGQEGVQD